MSAQGITDDGGTEVRKAAGGSLDDGLNRLWIERIAETLHFDSLAGRILNRPDLAPYLLFATVYAIDIPVLSSVQYLRFGYHPFIANPSNILVPVGLAFAIWASRSLRSGYETAIQELNDNEGVEQFKQELGIIERVSTLVSAETSTAYREANIRKLVSNRLKIVLLLIGWAFHASWLFFNPEAMEYVFSFGGPVIGIIKFFGIIPFFYYIIGVDFASVYLGILLLLPLKLRISGEINFQDPLGYGHLKPIGDLIKSGTLYYFLAVGAYIIFMGVTAFLARRGAQLADVTRINTFGIAVTIVIGIVLFVLPILVIHGHMKHAKHAKIQQLAKEVEDRGPKDDGMMFPETSIPESVDEGHEYIQYFIKISKVENTHEYPVDVTHLQELVLAAFVPYLAHVTVTFLLTYTASGGH